MGVASVVERWSNSKEYISAATIVSAGILCALAASEAHSDDLPPSMRTLDTVIADLDELFRTEKEAAHIPGMAYGVILGGKLIHTATLGLANVEKGVSVNLNTRFRIASMTKSFTAMAVLQLKERGVLSLDDPVSKYVPSLLQVPTTKNATDYPRLTLRHLLIHAGGMPQEDPWVRLI